MYTKRECKNDNALTFFALGGFTRWRSIVWERQQQSYVIHPNRLCFYVGKHGDCTGIQRHFDDYGIGRIFPLKKTYTIVPPCRQAVLSLYAIRADPKAGPVLQIV